MNPSSPPVVNSTFGAPADLDESQVFALPALTGKILGGNLDGVAFVAVAWKPTDEDIARILKGGLIYLTCLGGLPPHFLSTRFSEASYGAHEDVNT
jgi:hypothetical protein